MKKMKHLIPAFLCIALTVVILASVAYATGEESTANVYINVDKENVHVGDTITVTFSTKAVTLHTLTGGIKFDPTQLECTSVTLAPANGNKLLIEKPLDPNSDNMDFRMVTLSTVNQANSVGQIGFVSVGMVEGSFAATDLFIATFKVLKIGAIEIVAREDSYQGSQNKEVQTITVTATERPANVNVTPLSRNVEFFVEGQVVTVTHDVACTVGYLDATSGKYVTTGIVKTKISDNSYKFEIPAGVTEIVLAIKGDVNGDGMITAADPGIINAYSLGRMSLTATQLFVADVVIFGTVNAADAGLVNTHSLGRTALAW